MLSFAASALGALKRVPWQVWVILTVAALWWFERDAHGDARYAEGIAKMEAVTKESRRLAEEARKSEEQALLALSKETDNAVSQNRAVERDSTDRFIAAGGVPDNAVCPGGPAAPGKVHRTRDSAPVREAPVVDDRAALPATVRVYAEDVRTCTENTILAEEWRDLLLELEARSAGETE